MLRSTMADTTLFAEASQKIYYLQHNFPQFKKEIERNPSSLFIFIDEVEPNLIIALIHALAVKENAVSENNLLYILTSVIRLHKHKIPMNSSEEVGKCCISYLQLLAQILRPIRTQQIHENNKSFPNSDFYSDEVLDECSETLKILFLHADLEQKDSAGNSILHILASIGGDFYSAFCNDLNFTEGKCTGDLIAAMAPNLHGKTPFDLALESKNSEFMLQAIESRILNTEQLLRILTLITEDHLQYRWLINMIPAVLRVASISSISKELLYNLIRNCLIIGELDEPETSVAASETSLEGDERKNSHAIIVVNVLALSAIFWHLFNRHDWDPLACDEFSIFAEDNSDKEGIIALAVRNIVCDVFKSNDEAKHKKMYKYLLRSPVFMVEVCSSIFYDDRDAAEKKIIAKNIYETILKMQEYYRQRGLENGTFALIHLLILTYYEYGIYTPPVYIEHALSNACRNISLAEDNQLLECANLLAYLRTSINPYSLSGRLLSKLTAALANCKDDERVMQLTRFYAATSQRAAMPAVLTRYRASLMAVGDTHSWDAALGVIGYAFRLKL